MKKRFHWLCLLALAGTCTAVRPQQTSGFRLDAAYGRDGVPVPKWQFHFKQDGHVSYTSDHAPGWHAVQDGPVEFLISTPNAAKLLQLLNASHDMRPCETKIKGLARMGMKTFEFQPAGGAASQCTFNFTDNKPLNAAADLLIAISFTIEQGEVLDWMHRYDRLGLDAAMLQLTTAVKEGRATEISAIRPTLQSLVSDDAVLDRVRQQAATLLQSAAQ